MQRASVSGQEKCLGTIISTGRMFSDFLRNKGIDPEQFPYL